MEAREAVQPDGGRITTDLSHWPVIIITPPRTISDEQMRDHIAEISQVRRQRRTEYAMVLDLRNTDRITPTQRKMLTDRMGDDTAAELRQLCRGVAMVFESAMLRGVLTAIFWVRKSEYPCQVFGTVADAMTWCRGVLARG